MCAGLYMQTNSANGISTMIHLNPTWESISGFAGVGARCTQGHNPEASLHNVRPLPCFGPCRLRVAAHKTTWLPSAAMCRTRHQCETGLVNTSDGLCSPPTSTKLEPSTLWFVLYQTPDCLFVPGLVLCRPSGCDLSWPEHQ